jgi:hypothetical protein
MNTRRALRASNVARLALKSRGSSLCCNLLIEKLNTKRRMTIVVTVSLMQRRRRREEGITNQIRSLSVLNPIHFVCALEQLVSAANDTLKLAYIDDF